MSQKPLCQFSPTKPTEVLEKDVLLFPSVYSIGKTFNGRISTCFFLYTVYEGTLPVGYCYTLVSTPQDFSLSLFSAGKIFRERTKNFDVPSRQYKIYLDQNRI